MCIDNCTNSPDLFADNTTQKCVSVCPRYFYGDPSTHKCVLICPSSPDYFGNDNTK